MGAALVIQTHPIGRHLLLLARGGRGRQYDTGCGTRVNHQVSLDWSATWIREGECSESGGPCSFPSLGVWYCMYYLFMLDPARPLVVIRCYLDTDRDCIVYYYQHRVLHPLQYAVMQVRQSLHHPSLGSGKMSSTRTACPVAMDRLAAMPVMMDAAPSM